jgi:hypothetical protein
VLQVGDQVVVSQDEKEKAVFEFYEIILGKAEERNFTLDLDELVIQHHVLFFCETPCSICSGCPFLRGGSVGYY